MNSCTTLEQGLELDPNIAARAQAIREGRKLPELHAKFVPVRGFAKELGLDKAPDVYEGPPLAPLPPAEREFHSRPDARPMSEEIRIRVVRYADAGNFVMRYRDPFTGRWVSRSTGTASDKEALKIAAQKKADLLNRCYKSAPRVTRDFRSAPDARPMSRRDIANVQFLNLETAKDILQAVAQSAPQLAAKALMHVEQHYQELLTEGERFALSAMAARKFMRELQPV